MTLESRVDASFTAPFLIDNSLLDWNPGSRASDLTKKTIYVGGSLDHL